MQWFRMYEGVLDDPKVQRLPPEIFKGWVNLLCLATRNEGVLPSIQDIAFALRVTEEHAIDIIDTLCAQGLLDKSEDDLTPHNWEGRQYKSDTSTDRVKRFRQRSVKQDETVSVTPPETEQNRTESETDISAEFDVWYVIYPLHKSRGQALKAYRAARKKTDAETLIRAAERYRDDPARKPEFTKHPASWLNGECWADESKPPDRPPDKIDPVRALRDKVDCWRKYHKPLASYEIREAVKAGLMTEEEARAA